MKTTDNQNEMFIVVDNDDNIIGYKTRYECHHDKTLIHRAIGVLVYNSEGQMLLQKRSMTKDTYPGFWTISCGGHVTKGQSYEDAAIRELKEELGIEVKALTLVKKWLIRMPTETEFGVLFKIIYDGPFYPDAKEVAEVIFFIPKDIPNLVQLKELQLSSGGENTLKEIGLL